MKTTNQTYAAIAINDSRIKSNMNITTNINLPNYYIEYLPTECHTGGILLYINYNIAYKPRKDLFIYKSYKLESTFIEINPPSQKEIRTIFLLLDFNIDLLICDSYTATNEFVYSHPIQSNLCIMTTWGMKFLQSL